LSPLNLSRYRLIPSQLSIGPLLRLWSRTRSPAGLDSGRGRPSFHLHRSAHRLCVHSLRRPSPHRARPNTQSQTDSRYPALFRSAVVVGRADLARCRARRATNSSAVGRWPLVVGRSGMANRAEPAHSSLERAVIHDSGHLAERGRICLHSNSRDYLVIP